MPEHNLLISLQKRKGVSDSLRTPEVNNKPNSHPSTIIQKSMLDRRALTPANIIQLQKTIGNKAVCQLLRELEALNPVPLQTKSENLTGMPNKLKNGVENLSGIDMSDVRVHYNSGKPSEVGALAYTQGTDIHVASGQDRHLPHEAWHVVQQKQGRVQPTIQTKGLPINDDPELENEADTLGARAMAFEGPAPLQMVLGIKLASSQSSTVQCTFDEDWGKELDDKIAKAKGNAKKDKEACATDRRWTVFKVMLKYAFVPHETLVARLYLNELRDAYDIPTNQINYLFEAISARSFAAKGDQPDIKPLKKTQEISVNTPDYLFGDNGSAGRGDAFVLQEMEHPNVRKAILLLRSQVEYKINKYVSNVTPLETVRVLANISNLPWLKLSTAAIMLDEMLSSDQKKAKIFLINDDRAFTLEEAKSMKTDAEQLKQAHELDSSEVMKISSALDSTDEKESERGFFWGMFD